MSENLLNRRDLIQLGATTACALVGGAIIQPLAALAETAAPAAKPIKYIDPATNPTARQLKYTHDATTATTRKIAHAVCGNCQMFRPKTQVDGVEVGGCNMIGGGWVKGTGWCTSWVADAKKIKKP